MVEKKVLDISFAQGLDTKTDPFRVVPGKFLKLVNSVFTKGGLLQKRNGFKKLSTINNANYLTTYNGNLTAISNKIEAYTTSNNTFISKGNITPLNVSTSALVRNSLNQTQADAVMSDNGLVCVVYTEVDNTTTTYKYAIYDGASGETIVAPTALPNTGSANGTPRVFLVQNLFIIIYTQVITGTPHLRYIAIHSNNPLGTPTAPQDIASSYVSTARLSWDGVVANNNLYIAYNTTSGGQSIKASYLSLNALAVGGPPSSAVTFAGKKATSMALAADLTIPQSPTIYIVAADSTAPAVTYIAVDKNLNTVYAPSTDNTAPAAVNITCAAQNGAADIYIEVADIYGAPDPTPTNYISYTQFIPPSTPAGFTVIQRGVGLASKAFIYQSKVYAVSAYQSAYQSSYFLLDLSDTTTTSPQPVAKFAYQNGGGYLPTGLPSALISDGIVQFAYLFKDLIAPVNKNTAVPAGSQVAGIYTQTGINFAAVDFSSVKISASEIGKDLHISGGLLWMYDGSMPVEHNFLLYPDHVNAAPSAQVGSLSAQQYYYVAVYQWTDNQGNAFYSAPSVPVPITVVGPTTATDIRIGSLRLTYKIASPVKVVIYRWSAAQQSYYQVTSLTAPLLNDTTADEVTFTDTLSDAQILGNSLLYTTGGVVEDVAAPATNLMTLFDGRMWLVDAEDPNLLWFSKQVIEGTPVEFSDLFTYFISPTTAAQGSTGPTTAIAPLDDKLITFKKNAIYYINGSGPDNTGNNNQYSQPIFITSTVGCSEQASIVFTPNGLMFQSEKGIWLLGRDLSTSYIGAAVEEFNSAVVKSAVNVPSTNQVRFALDTGEQLMYDYYYQQWGTFSGVPAISSCIYNNLHTLLNANGAVSQETPGVYLDSSTPVLMSFKTGWFNLAGLQGYQRTYFFYLLGTYYSPHKLSLQMAYDYGPPTQLTVVSPNNYAPTYGTTTPYGQEPLYGGPGNIEQWQISLQQQLCQSMQITLNEIYNPIFSTQAGAGLTLSGINLVYSAKKGYKPIRPINSTG